MFGGRDSLETPRSPSCPQTTPQPLRRIRLPTSSLYSWACAKWTPECHRPWPAILHLLRPRMKSAALPDRCGDVVFWGPWCSLGIADTPQLNQQFANWDAHIQVRLKNTNAESASMNPQKCAILAIQNTPIQPARKTSHLPFSSTTCLFHSFPSFFRGCYPMLYHPLTKNHTSNLPQRPMISFLQAAVISVSHTDLTSWSNELIAVTGPSGTTQRMTGLVIHPQTERRVRAWYGLVGDGWWEAQEIASFYGFFYGFSGKLNQEKTKATQAEKILE